MGYSMYNTTVVRYPHKIEHGAYYLITIFGRPMRVQFIQPTERGFNFLNLNTAKCVLKRHVYLQKGTKNTFWLGNYCQIISKL